MVVVLVVRWPNLTWTYWVRFSDVTTFFRTTPALVVDLLYNAVHMTINTELQKMLFIQKYFWKDQKLQEWTFLAWCQIRKIFGRKLSLSCAMHLFHLLRFDFIFRSRLSSWSQSFQKFEANAVLRIMRHFHILQNFPLLQLLCLITTFFMLERFIGLQCRFSSLLEDQLCRLWG